MDKENSKIFYRVLLNNFIVSLTNMFIWCAITFWVYLETQSVLATSYIAGTFVVANMLLAFYFGSVVDHNRKKTAMIYSSILSLVAYLLSALVFFTNDPLIFKDPSSPQLWLLIVLIIFGAVAGNLRMIALSTTVTMLFKEGRDKANGWIGTTQGISFAFSTVLSGLAIGFYSMDLAIIVTIVLTALALIHLSTVPLPEAEIVHAEDQPKKIDIKKTILIISLVPGLFALIFFTTFNNFLGGLFMSLMDPYGLSLMSVQAWGVLLAFVGTGFIVGGIFIARYGLGANPLRRLLLINLVTWTTCILFVIQPSIILLAVGMFIWMAMAPFMEACEHTIIQKVVPFEKQGRVFGFAQSVESAASPITAFLVGPLAQFVFIPFMTTGAGVALIGDWFGTGTGRGIALVFILAGIIGLIVTLLALRSKSYRQLSQHVLETPIVKQA